ncbi:hypothetical protein [Pedobacter cryophilus]|uniref:Cadherin-like beta sandwich domain-containing protein n=1 Tax=Pedobacter cryophilus TaxID=2571271 RepID=A0A4U1C690_9SPHI|nr:hypothetical protein [Pedobacter cryophilus]TKB98880.1 hypothetical protein FA046_07130 [Pedobacter cryophilus]
MKKIAFCFIALFIYSHSLLAQAPNWAVKESDYQYTMTFVAKLNVDGKRLVNPNDKVAAFVGNICRGVSGVTYVASEKNYYAFLTVFANQQGENISFRLYDAEANKTTTVSKQTAFVVNEHKGNLFQSYSIAEPALNYQSEILSFNFMNITSLASIINSNTVKINISESYPLANLKPVFTLSKGANLYKNRMLQKSGEVTDNFSSPITYEVLSEDESTLNSYTVSVSQSTDPTLFYRKNAVCYARGAIKVVSKKEGAEVKVTSDGKTVATKKITNGEALFSELNAGSYIATVGNEFKVINILMKDK